MRKKLSFWMCLFALIIICGQTFSWIALAFAEESSPGTSQKQKTFSFFKMVEESFFGDPTDPWRPISLSTFFSEGWDEPFDYPVKGSGGAPRQGWINSLDGVFYRLWFLSYGHTQNFHDNGNQDFGRYTLFAPVSRRFQIRFDVPFLVSNRGGEQNGYHNNFGDFVISPRFLLSETQDVSQIFTIAVRTPTGEKENGHDVFSITPEYQFWSNVYNTWVVRGGIGTTFPTQSNRGRYSFNYNVAIGKYLTSHDQTPFGDLTLYVAANGFTTLDNRASDVNFFSMTPGFRSHMGRDWYLLAGVEVPLTGPDSASFDYETNVWVMKVF
ncbi:MAG TPA: hypothetical protein VLA60_12390 [Nitrospirales bacterium]|nr:hypothetical protein [Nitrospirales bacterium]